MGRVLIVSDTHGKNTNLEKVAERLKPLDLLLHLGDAEGSESYISQIGECPTYLVKGNCDYYGTLPYNIVLPYGTHTIFMTHGHRYFVNYDLKSLKEAARRQKADIVLYGHTHVPYLEQTEDMTILNPGSLSKPRQADKRCSYAIMETDREGGLHFTICYL